ncbi:MAG: 50S ribosomal protein L25 [Acidobacteria bacterium]|nr:50S ribosomal protein L25 [Acidobacteriota bacterium]
MKKDIIIDAEPRESRGKNEARRLRARGLAPAIVYGAGKDPVAVAVKPQDITKILQSATGHNSIFEVKIAAVETTPVMVVDWLNDPIKNNLLHCDLKRIDMTKRISVKVPVKTSGEPRGVKEQSGIYEIVTREVEIECLPAEIPDVFTLDVRGLMLGQSLRVSEIPLTGSMKLLTPGDNLISHVVALRAEAEPAAEGAAAAAEPEVIKKGKKEEEGAADDKKKK